MDSNYGPYSEAITLETGYNPQLQTMPQVTGLTGYVDGSTIHLAWTDVFEASHYRIAYSGDAGVTWALLNIIPSSNAIGETYAHTIDGTVIKFEKTYLFKVRALEENF
jgi:hypothetical protein